MIIDEKIKAMDDKKFEMAIKIEKEEKELEKASSDARLALKGTKEEFMISAENEKSCYDQLMASHSAYSDLYTQRDEYAKAVCKYSQFNSLFIVDVIAALISVYQGEEYVVRHATYYLKEQIHNMQGVDGDDKHILHPLVIVTKDCDAQEYFKGENDLAELERNGKAIVLRKQEYVWMHKGISFYTEAEHVDLRSIPYAQNFVDGVIEYRIENKLDVIDEETLMSLLSAFIEANFDQIVANRKKVAPNQNVSSKEEINAQIIKKFKNKSGN